MTDSDRNRVIPLVETEKRIPGASRCALRHRHTAGRIALLRGPGLPAASAHHIELLEYRSPRGARGAARTCTPGNVHVSFVVNDLDAVDGELRDRGLRFKSPPVAIDHGRNRGAKAVYLLDPDDITLELVQPTPRA
jgi:catechol 2,3-dioxygenase-like lactoylglutathione lyase family enzyme